MKRQRVGRPHVGAKHDVGYLTKWLKAPASQRPTAHMPKIGLSDAEAKALAADLGSLPGSDAAPRRDEVIVVRFGGI